MKLLNYILLLTLVITLSACKTGFQNFNKQKFTHLNQLKPAKDKSNIINVQFPEIEKPETNNAESDSVSTQTVSVEEININPEQKEFIIDELSKGTKIIVKKGDSYYYLRDTKYDRFYDALIGEVKSVNPDDLEGEYLLIETSKIDQKLGKSTVYFKSITSAEMRKFSVNKENTLNEVEETSKDLSTDVKNSRDENQIRKKQIQQTKANRVLNSHRIALISLGVIAILAMMCLLFYSVGLLIAIGGAVLIGIIARFVGVIAFQKYKRYSEENGFTIDQNLRLRSTLMIIGVVIQSLPLALLLLIIIFLFSL